MPGLKQTFETCPPVLIVQTHKVADTRETALREKAVTQSRHPNRTIYNVSRRPSSESVFTCSGSQQPAVQVTGCHGEIKHQGPLAVNRVQNVLHCHRGVGVRVLLARLPLHQQVSEGSCASAFGHSQSLVVVAWRLQALM